MGKEKEPERALTRKEYYVGLHTATFLVIGVFLNTVYPSDVLIAVFKWWTFLQFVILIVIALFS